MTPRCHNRAPFADSHTRHVLDAETGAVVKVTLAKWFTDRCTLTEGRGYGPDTSQTFAQWQGYECGGCRWLAGAGA